MDQAIAVDSEHEAENIQNGVDPVLKVVNKCVHDMIFKTIVTAALDTPPQRDQLVYKVRWNNVISVAWTNILIELVQRNNSLIEHFHPQSSFLNYDNNCYFHTNYSMTSADNSGTSSYYNILPKRNCIGMNDLNLYFVTCVISYELLNKFKCFQLYSLYFIVVLFFLF